MDSSGWQFLALRIAAFNRASESSGGKARALADAFGDLDNDLIDTATAADKVAAALSSLLDPTLDAEAATDQWMKSLATLRNELESDVGFDGAGARMLKNKELTRDYVEDAKARLIALAGLSETTEGQMAAAVQKTRTAFIESGIAAGFSRKEIEKRANELNLTPELVKTTFEAAGIDRSILQVREARRNIEALPKKVQTVVRADGIPRTIGEVNALVKKYNLTEKERRALITLRDLASKGIGIVDGKLKRIDGKKADPKVGLNTGKFDANSARVARQNAIMDRAKPTPTANLNTAPFNGKYGGTMGSLNTLNAYKANPTANLIDNASGVAGFIRSQIAAIQSKTVTITAYYRSTGAIKPPGERAGGGLITGPGGPTDDQIPTLLSNREFVQRNAAVEYYGENFMHALNSLRVPREAVRGYADGGMVTRADRASQILRESGSARTRVRAGAPIGRGGGRLRIDLGEVRVSGAIDAATGMAVIEGRARAWARDELESVADHDYEMAGMSEDD